MISEGGWRVPTPDGAEDVRPFQIIVRVIITAEDVREWDPGAATIPVMLDIGNNHNFAIRRVHWDRWIRWEPRRIGQISVGGSIVPLFAANLWIHSNRGGERGPERGNTFTLSSWIKVLRSIRLVCPILPAFPSSACAA